VLSAPHPAAAPAALAAALGQLPLVAVHAPDGKVWIWIACELCERDVVAALRDGGRGKLLAGVSGHEAGAEGFRAAHRKAALALRLGRRQGRAVTAFADVALEALAFGGEQLAREFVVAEMGALTGGGRRTDVLRATLSAYFAAGTTAAAARSLGVSERTVTYRLRHVERLLGRSLTTRRAELETALRLHGVFVAAAA
jgi:DNA-binding PucR family transcriptional regulator